MWRCRTRTRQARDVHKLLELGRLHAVAHVARRLAVELKDAGAVTLLKAVVDLGVIERHRVQAVKCQRRVRVTNKVIDHLHRVEPEIVHLEQAPVHRVSFVKSDRLDNLALDLALCG